MRAMLHAAAVATTMSSMARTIAETMLLKRTVPPATLNPSRGHHQLLACVMTKLDRFA